MKQDTIIPLLKFDNTFPFMIKTIKSLAGEPDEKNELPHSHNYYELIWMIKGTGKLYVDLQEYTVENNTIFYLKPNQAHQFQLDPEMEGFVLSFTDSFFKSDEHEFDWTCQASLFQVFSHCQVISISHELESDIKEVALRMFKEFENLHPFRTQLLKRLFKVFLIYLTRQLEDNFQAEAQSRDLELIKSFMEKLDKSFKEKKMLADYAAQLSISPNYLNRIIKKNTGYSAGHHIRQRVVLEAKRLGRFSDAAMKEIAYDLGFSDSAHFSKYFKAMSGTNFSEFRKLELCIPLNGQKTVPDIECLNSKRQSK